MHPAKHQIEHSKKIWCLSMQRTHFACLLQAHCEATAASKLPGVHVIVVRTHLWVWCRACSCPEGRRVGTTRGCGVLGSTRALQDTQR